jgi:hypothetical protein
MSGTRPLPVVVCRKTHEAPAMDGSFFHPAWQAAEPVAAFRRLRQRDEETLVSPHFGTELRCLWDDRFLYVGFRCTCPDVWATRTQRDTDLWEEPVCEVFLDPSGQGKNFFEFQVNPLGTIYDSFVADAAQSADWPRWARWTCQGLVTAVHVEGRLNDRSSRDEGWSAQFAIPFAALAAEVKILAAAGAAWWANFCRYDYSAQLPQPELSCVAPTVAVFDDLARFCVLRFEE